MTLSTREIGRRAETHAMHYLQTHGLQLIDRNHRSYVGEIDLIMKDKDTLVFIEVRYHKKPTQVHILETINRHKQQRIIKTAQHYLIDNQLYDKIACRFDIVAFNLAKDLEDPIWIKDAFRV